MEISLFSSDAGGLFSLLAQIVNYIITQICAFCLASVSFLASLTFSAGVSTHPSQIRISSFLHMASAFCNADLIFWQQFLLLPSLSDQTILLQLSLIKISIGFAVNVGHKKEEKPTIAETVMCAYKSMTITALGCLNVLGRVIYGYFTCL